MATGGNRHMATSRPHNRIHRRRGGGHGLTAAERRARADSIHNRGPQMNPEEQKRQATLREEFVKLAEATAEELAAFDLRLTQLQAQVTEQAQHRITGDNEERTRCMRLGDHVRVQATQQRAYVDDRDRVLHREIACLHARLVGSRLRAFWARVQITLARIPRIPFL